MRKGGHGDSQPAISVRWVLTIVNGRNVLAGAEAGAANKIAGLLSLVGFAPSRGGAHLGAVLVGLWLLMITAFSPIQLLAGMPLYILFFPLSILIVLFYRKAINEGAAGTQQSNTIPFPKAKRRFPVVPVAITFLVVWFVLFGGSSARRPNLMGCIISGTVFLAFAYRALDKTSPIDEGDTAVFSRWLERGVVILSNAAQKLIDSPPKNKLEAVVTLRINGFLIMPFRHLPVVFRGRRGRDRIHHLFFNYSRAVGNFVLGPGD